MKTNSQIILIIWLITLIPSYFILKKYVYNDKSNTWQLSEKFTCIFCSVFGPAIIPIYLLCLIFNLDIWDKEIKR